MYYTEKEVKIEMSQLFDKFNINDWNFTFDNAKRRLGVCRHRSKTIGLSRAYLPITIKKEIKDVLLHEIVHALVGKNNSHNEVWRRKFIDIGGDGERLYKGKARVEPKFAGTCPNCGRVVKKHRRTKIACGKCCTKYNHGIFSSEYLFVWGINN